MNCDLYVLFNSKSSRLSSSNFNLVVIAVERLQCIRNPLTHNTTNKKWKLFTLLILPWILGMLMVCHVPMATTHHRLHGCYAVYRPHVVLVMAIFISLVLCGVLPIVLLLTVYIWIWIILRQHKTVRLGESKFLFYNYNVNPLTNLFFE